MRLWQQEFRIAARRLWGSAGFTVFSVASIALGLGGTTAMYSIVQSLLWSSTGVREPDEVVAVLQAGQESQGLSWPDFRDLQANQVSFRGLAASQQIQVALVGQGTADIAFAEAVNGEYFETLGAAALAGRLINESDDRLSAPVVVISESLWRQKCSADPEMVGKTLKVSGHPYTVLGIVRSPFRGLRKQLPTSAWIPATTVRLLPDMVVPLRDPRGLGDRNVVIRGRLRGEASLRAASAEVSLLGQRLDDSYPTGSSRRLARAWSVASSTATEPASIQMSTIGGLLILAVALVLVIACTNIGNLFLARGFSRSNELAVRRSIGASRQDLIRSLFAESAIVALLGTAGGILVAKALMEALSGEVVLAQGLTINIRPEFTPEVVLTALAAVLLSLLAFGLWPALYLTRSEERLRLLSGETVVSGGWRSHRRLVTWQVTGSVALVLVAAACARVISIEARHDSGVALDELAVAQVDFRVNGRDEQETRRSAQAVVERMRSQQGVSFAAASVGLPFGVPTYPVFVSTPDRPFSSQRDTDAPHAYAVAGTTDILRTLGVRLVAGRSFDQRDREGSALVVVLSESLAQVLFKGATVLGQEVLLGRTSRSSERFPPKIATVIGVVANTDVRQLTKTGHLAYIPLDQETGRLLSTITFSARMATQATSPGTTMLTKAIHHVDPDLAVSSAGVASRVLGGPFALMRVVGGIAVTLGLMALVLAMAGLYGVLSHATQRRTRELGVRMALGARRATIIRLVIGEGLKPVLNGLLFGLTAGALGRMAVQSMVAQPLSPIDPISFSLIPIPFLIAGTVASYLPARRASTIEPTVALREL